MARDPKLEAESLLRSAWQGRGLPVDPIIIAHELGIDVVVSSLEPGISGKLSKMPGFDARITLNRDDSKNRIRFTCAHELGHYVSHSDEPDSYHYVDRRDPLSATGQSAEERFANQFAASLLMPEGDVRQRWTEGSSESALAYQFGVSQEAMNFRLRNLGLLG
jgi:hypothetical protein